MWLDNLKKVGTLAKSVSGVLGTYTEYKADKFQTKFNKRMQTYRNKMANIANSINQNVITQNTTLTIQQSARQAAHLRKKEITTTGSIAVAAAASGTKGRSVNATLLDAQRNFGLIEKRRVQDLEEFFMQTRQQRIGSALSAVQNQDLSYIPSPRLSTYLFKNLEKDLDILKRGVETVWPKK